jgi:putative hydrolases of HD superfamily
MDTTMSSELTDLMRFVRFTNDFRLVHRTFLARGRDTHENDAEHSYQMAMCAWFVHERLKLGLNMEKILTYALVHDLVEVYAGDTPTIGSAAKGHSAEQKQEREQQALMRIKEEWHKEFPGLVDAMEAYEAKSDPESLLIYTLDKTITKINNIEDNGRNWHRNPTTLEEIDTYTRSKVAKFPPVGKLYEEIYEFLKKNPSLFPAG